MDVRRSHRVFKPSLENHRVPGNLLRVLSMSVASMFSSPGLQSVGIYLYIMQQQLTLNER